MDAGHIILRCLGHISSETGISPSKNILQIDFFVTGSHALKNVRGVGPTPDLETKKSQEKIQSF